MGLDMGTAGREKRTTEGDEGTAHGVNNSVKRAYVINKRPLFNSVPHIAVINNNIDFTLWLIIIYFTH